MKKSLLSTVLQVLIPSTLIMPLVSTISTSTISASSVLTWEDARRNNFSLYPRTNANYCVTNVQSAFEAIDFGRNRGANFYSIGVGRADSGHMQGVARLPGGWIVQSFTRGVFLTHFPGKANTGRRVWATGPEQGNPVFPTLPDVPRNHVGGVHAYNNIVAVPSDGGGESRVEIFQHRSGDLKRISRFNISNYQPKAHYASILPLVNGDWLLAVGRDERRRRGPHRIHFYIIPRVGASQNQLRYLGRWGRGRTRDDFQSASLIAGCNGNVYIIGTGVRVVQSNAHAKLFQILSFKRSGGGRPEVGVNKLKERSPNSERNDCNLNAAATFFPTSDQRLAMYCTEKEIRNGDITTREYRDER